MIKLDNLVEKFQAILFDFDGVLAESANVKTEAFEKLYEPYGEQVVKKVIDHHIKHGGISRYKKMELYHSEFLNKNLSKEELNDLAKEYSKLVVTKVIDSIWVPGVKDFLEKYHDKIDMYVVSGTPQEELELIVKKRGMQKYFKGVFGTPATKPEIADNLIKQNGYDKNRVLYIGDSLSDYNDSKKAEIVFLGRVPKGENSIFPDGTEIITDFSNLKL
jgi:HAD superfamily hydrolase (TIGR01549 family)